MRRKKIKLSVVVPVFNEEKRVQNIIKLHSFIKNKTYFHELVVVNDGSKDKTRNLLYAMAKKTKMRVVSYGTNKGKGFAIRKGIFSARGTHVLFMDVDLSTPPQTIGKLLLLLRKNGGVFVGTRKVGGSYILQRQPFLRELMGRFFTTLSQWVTGVQVSDFTCGFKCFSRVAAVQIAKKQKINRWAFDSEMLFLAKKMGLSIVEFPVVWKNDRRTKVRFPQDVFLSLFDLFSIKVRDVWGMY